MDLWAWSSDPEQIQYQNHTDKGGVRKMIRWIDFNLVLVKRMKVSKHFQFFDAPSFNRWSLIPFPLSWAVLSDSVLRKRMWWKWQCVTSETRSQKALWYSLFPSRHSLEEANGHVIRTFKQSYVRPTLCGTKASCRQPCSEPPWMWLFQS